jgi:hypothetical protein
MSPLAFGQICFAVQNSNNEVTTKKNLPFSFHDQIKYLDQFFWSLVMVIKFQGQH